MKKTRITLWWYCDLLTDMFLATVPACNSDIISLSLVFYVTSSCSQKGTEKKQKNKAKKSKEIMAVEFAAPKREQVDERDGGKGKGGKGGKGKGKGEFGASPAATKPRVKQGPAPVMDEHSFPSL